MKPAAARAARRRGSSIRMRWPLEPRRVQQGQRHLGGLAGAGRRLQHQARMRREAGRDLRQQRRDREFGRGHAARSVACGLRKRNCGFRLDHAEARAQQRSSRRRGSAIVRGPCPPPSGWRLRHSVELAATRMPTVPDALRSGAQGHEPCACRSASHARPRTRKQPRPASPRSRMRCAPTGGSRTPRQRPDSRAATGPRRAWRCGGRSAGWRLAPTRAGRSRSAPGRLPR